MNDPVVLVAVISSLCTLLVAVLNKVTVRTHGISIEDVRDAVNKAIQPVLERLGNVEKRLTDVETVVKVRDEICKERHK